MRRKYSRQSKRPRSVLKRRSSGKAHTSRRFPKRRTYKGTDTHLRGSKQLRSRPNDVEPVYGAAAAVMGTLDIMGIGMAVIVISCMLISLQGKMTMQKQYDKDLETFKTIESQLKILWDGIYDPEIEKGQVWNWIEWISTKYPDMKPDTKLTEGQLTEILTHDDTELSIDDVNELVTDFKNKPLKVFLYCILKKVDVADVPQLPEKPTPVKW